LTQLKAVAHPNFAAASEPASAARSRYWRGRRFLRKFPTLVLGACLLTLLLLAALCAPWLATHDPAAMAPELRLQAPSSAHLFGTDALGRDIYSRALFGARVSLLVAASVTAVALLLGGFLGMVAGFVRALDAPVMRVMDGLMAIPGVLLAIAVTSLTRPGLSIVIIAIVVPEVPRVVRLVRSLTLQLREQVFVEAARAVGTPTLRILSRHILPNTLAPLTVQGTAIAASAVLVEAALSFLGVGVPADLPSWGIMIAEARGSISVALFAVAWPGAFLALTVLAMNLLGDGLRDRLDPRLARSL
jgi:peptide/nickel transport system permease protein